jgi:hypothetical protein
MGSTMRDLFPAGDSYFFFSIASTQAMGPTQPPIYFVPGAISRKSGRGVEPTTHLHIMPSRMVELYLHSLIDLHSIVLN